MDASGTFSFIKPAAYYKMHNGKALLGVDLIKEATFTPLPVQREV